MPTVSVALTTCNRAAFVGELLESIAAQVRSPDELVVVDDASEDDTVGIIERFALGAPMPVRVYRNEVRLGGNANVGAAVDRCTGDLVALADDDDVWWPSKLACLESTLVACDAALVFSDAVVIDERGADTGRRLWECVGADADLIACVTSDLAFDVLLDERVVTGPTMMLTAQACRWATPIPDVVAARARRAISSDAWMALSTSAASRIVAVDEPLLGYRRHPGQNIGLPLGPPTLRTPPDWGDPQIAGPQVAWIDEVLELLTTRGVPCVTAGVAEANVRRNRLIASASPSTPG